MRTNKCTSVASHLDSHGSARVLYKAHRLMEDIQGHLGSHWMPPLGNYLLHIAPSAARVTANKATINKRYHIPWLLWWPWRCAGTIPGASSDKGGLGLQQMQLVAATGRVLRPIIAVGHAYIGVFQVFSLSTCYKRAWVDVKATNNNRGMTYWSHGNGFSKMMWYLHGGGQYSRIT